MNKTEVNKTIKIGQLFLEMIDPDKLEELKGEYEDIQAAAQDKIDRLESMENLGDANQERLDQYNERMEQLESMIEMIDTLLESREEFGDCLQTLEDSL